MNYNITVSEDRAGNLSVTSVDRIVKVNQYKSDTQRMPKSIFSVSRLTDNPKVRAARKTKARSTRTSK